MKKRETLQIKCSHCGHVAELAYARDLKSLDLGHVGSNPIVANRKDVSIKPIGGKISVADSRRNIVFATFLKRQFPNPPINILDVACGDGSLSVQLAKVFPLATITGIDPRPRGDKRRVKILKGKFPERVKVQQ